MHEAVVVVVVLGGVVVVLGGVIVVRGGVVVIRGGDVVGGGAVVVGGSGVLVELGLGVVGVEVRGVEVVGADVRVVEVEMGDGVVWPGSGPFVEPHPPATSATASAVTAKGPYLIRGRRVIARIAVASSVHPLDARWADRVDTSRVSDEDST